MLASLAEMRKNLIGGCTVETCAGIAAPGPRPAEERLPRGRNTEFPDLAALEARASARADALLIRAEQLEQEALRTEELAAKYGQQRRSMEGEAAQAHGPLNVPSAFSLYLTFLSVLMCSGSQFVYTVMAILPASCTLLTPDSAVETSSQMMAFVASSIVIVPFVNDFVDRSGDCSPIVQALAACTLLSNALFTIALKTQSVELLWAATLVAGLASQTSLLGITAALSVTFVTAAPEHAGVVNAMYMFGTNTIAPIGLIGYGLFPISNADADGDGAQVDVTVFGLNIFTTMLGWIIFLNLPKDLFNLHRYTLSEAGSRPPRGALGCCNVVGSVFQGVASLFGSRNYRGLLVSGIVGGSFTGQVNIFVVLSVYYLEDWTDSSGDDVQQIYAMSYLSGLLLSAFLSTPFGMLVDRIGALPCVYIGSFSLAGVFCSLLVYPPTTSLIVGALVFTPSGLSLYIIAILPYLLVNVFPDQSTLSRDMGMWFAMGAPVTVGITSAQGVILSSFGTTGEMMLGNRGRYNQEGYQACFSLSAAGCTFFPLILHMTGACCKPSFERERADLRML
jgi:hypothetical protein